MVSLEQPASCLLGSCVAVGSMLPRFFGFLRSGEFTAAEDGEVDPGQHLSFSDIAVDSLSTPKVLSVHIKQSKTDPFRLGVTILWAG